MKSLFFFVCYLVVFYLQAIDEKIRELSNCHIVYPGIDFQKVFFTSLFVFAQNLASG